MEGGAADWDLLAVVRSCCNTTTTTTSPPPQVLSPPPQQPQQELSFPPPPPTPPSSASNAVLFRFTSPFEASTTSFLGGQQDLQDICKPSLINCTTTTSTTSSCTFNTAAFQPLSSPSLSSPVSPSSPSVIAGRSFGLGEQPQLRRLIKPTQVIFGAHPAGATAPCTSQGQRAKKRKNLMKKVCHVPAEGLSNVMWAWRKYGQKPIKGSPYPRGYYRCSSSKGCLARKQVERNRSDPKMFIVTYTAEHNHPMPTHRNSLAGSTRQKTTTTTTTTNTTAGAGETSGAEGTPPEQPTCSSNSGASLSPLTEKSESKTEGEEMMKEEEDNEMGLSDLMLEDVFYVGFEQIDGGGDESDCFSEGFSPTMEFPWLASSSSSSSAATAAGGS